MELACLRGKSELFAGGKLGQLEPQIRRLRVVEDREAVSSESACKPRHGGLGWASSSEIVLT